MDDEIHQVLLVEPDPEVQREMTGFLDGDLVVLVASSMKAALDIAWKRDPAVAVIDVAALTESAEQTVSALRAASPGLRAVFVSADQDPEHLRKLAGVGAVLLKPVVKERLVQAVRNALRFQGMSAGVEALRARTGSFVVPSVLPPPRKPSDKH
jgi:DNA-binding NarL/FixJ family response regulator